MTLHVKATPIPNGKSVAVGTVEVWAEDAKSDADKMLAQILAKSVKDSIEGLNMMAEAIFDLPKWMKENGVTEEDVKATIKKFGTDKIGEAIDKAKAENAGSGRDK